MTRPAPEADVSDNAPNHTGNIQPANIRIPLTIRSHPSLTATMEVGYGLRLESQ